MLKMLARVKKPAFGLRVTTAKAGLQVFRMTNSSWIPAFAGMTSHKSKASQQQDQSIERTSQRCSSRRAELTPCRERPAAEEAAVPEARPVAQLAVSVAQGASAPSVVPVGSAQPAAAAAAG